MRGTLDDLATPYPLHTLLPAVLAEDDFAVRFTRGLDAVLAAMICSIDCLSAYLDPRIAPEDFVAWLGHWTGERPQPSWSTRTMRDAVGTAIERQSRSGTVDGLREYLELITGGEVTIIDNCTTRWSLTPGETTPAVSPEVVVGVAVDDPDRIDAMELNSVISARKPAHVAHRLEVRAR
jgi:phage tail-like protein